MKQHFFSLLRSKNMKKVKFGGRFILIGLFLLFSKLVNSQDFHYGLYAGANINTMKIANDLYINSNVDDTEKLMSLGFRAGFFGEYSFNDYFGVEMDLSFSQHGYRLMNEFEFYGDNSQITLSTKEEKMSNDISLALMFKYYTLNKKLSIDLGVQPAYTFMVRSFASETLKQDSLNVNFSSNLLVDTVLVLDKSTYNPFNLSVTGGVTCYFSENVFMTIRYMFGLTDLFVKEVGKFDEEGCYYTERVNLLSRNRVLQLGLGWRF